uniref:PB1 domain-containing protein n=1 Tax=Vitis vinifera TaxID=29760 RepID=A5AEZ7_VITVI|nr:hypothetical protein VITISV_018278 [Vitis vinifera]
MTFFIFVDTLPLLIPTGVAFHAIVVGYLGLFIVYRSLVDPSDVALRTNRNWIFEKNRFRNLRFSALAVDKEEKWEYVGGRSKCIHTYKGMSFEEFTQRVLEKFNISLDVMRMHYALKFNPRVIQDLEDEDDLDNAVSHSDEFANVYIVESPRVEAIEENIPNTQLTFG